MILELDKYNHLEEPSFILCKPNNDRIDIIKCTDKKATIKFNDYDEITFTTYLYIDGIKNDVYDKINELMHIELPEIGRYVISNININSEGTNLESKECTALSEEVLLAQKYLELFTINMGTTESIDGVQFCNLSNPNKSLLHLALEKSPNWSIGHIDNELYEMQRCFEITRQDVYSFLTQDVSKAFECIFKFDTINHLINIYTEKNIGEDTNIHISYANLAKSIDISSSTDDIKTCLAVVGADDLNFREVNMGYDRIYNLDYFHSAEYMSQELYEAYDIWKNIWYSRVNEYENLVVEYQKYYNYIYKLQSEMMPNDPESTDWTLYGLNPLKEKLSSYEQQQSVMIKAGQGEKTHKDYNTMYLPCYNTIQAIKTQLRKVEKELETLKNNQMQLGMKMNEIIELVDMKNNFTKKQLRELCQFIREDELSSDNFVVTDTMTDTERMDMLHEMLKYGQEELAKISVPTMQFSMDMVNIYTIPEFKEQLNKFDVGNYIYVTLRDDFSVKLRLLTIDVNFLDKNDFSVTFGNVAKLKGIKLFEDITNALELATSAATSVSFNSSNWNKANVESTNIGQMLSDGLVASGQRIATTKSDVIIDDRGIFIANNPNSDYKDDVIFIGGGQIVFSDDGLKTIKTALGRVQYTKDGTTYDDFGLLAQFVIAGYIAGSTIEGNKIIGGTVTGTKFNNGNGTFSVDENGYLKATSGNIAGWELTENAIYNKLIFNNKKNSNATGMGTYGSDWAFWAGNGKFSVKQDGTLVADSATITGKITATSGNIGGTNGFTIESGKMYSGTKSSLTDVDSGVYIGTDGISLGANSPFIVASDGALTAKSGTIGGLTLANDSISSTNGNFSVTSSGVVIAKDIVLTAKEGSTLGGITYGTDGTYGNFNNGFNANTSFGLTGNALADFDNLVVKNITADNIKATNVLANYVTTSTLEANYVTTNTLNTTTANINGKITALEGKFNTLEADFAQFDSLQLGSVGLGLGMHDNIQYVSWFYK